MTCLKPITLRIEADYVELPCMKCMACRIERTKEWTIRLLHESSTHDKNLYLTLTYSDENLPQDGTLVKSDLQYFIKRLRKYIGDKRIKYFACGEYGDELERPHYHLLIFGWSLELNDLIYLGIRKGRKRYTSKTIEKLWPFGFNEVGSVEEDSIRYVAGYIQKKLTGPAAAETYGKRALPFQLQSQGLGLNYLKENKKYFRDKLGCTFRGKEVGIPRYYIKKLKSESEEESEQIKKELLEKSREKIHSEFEYLKSTGEHPLHYNKIYESDRRQRFENLKAKNKLKRRGSL